MHEWLLLSVSSRKEMASSTSVWKQKNLNFQRAAEDLNSIYPFSFLFSLVLYEDKDTPSFSGRQEADLVVSSEHASEVSTPEYGPTKLHTQEPIENSILYTILCCSRQDPGNIYRIVSGIAISICLMNWACVPDVNCAAGLQTTGEGSGMYY